MRRSIVVPALLAGLTTATAFAQPVDLQIVHQDVTLDRAAGSARFSVTFNRDPVFVAIDNGQADAFQYEIDADSSDLSQHFGLSTVDTVIRGGEIWEGRGIPIRSATGDGGADAGGWGTLRALLPFDLNGSTVTFNAALADIAGADGHFRYRAFATENGAATTPVVGAVIPLPPGVIPGFVILGGLVAARKLRRIQLI